MPSISLPRSSQAWGWMISLMKNTYNEPPQAVYVEQGEISTAELQENGIEAEVFEIEGLPVDGHTSIMLLGNVFCVSYNFLPQAYRETKAIAAFAHYSIGISLALAVLSALFLFFSGFHNSSVALDYEQKTRRAQQEYAKDMSTLERDYASILKELRRLKSYQRAHQPVPGFPVETPSSTQCLGTITQAVPHDMALKRIDALRRMLQPDQAGNTAQPDGQEHQMPSTSNPSFRVRIEGVITAQYPQSKILFSTFLSGVQTYYPVIGASFQHTEERAGYSVECEAKK